MLELDETAQALLTDFSLTFGSRDAIEAWEAQWTVHEPAEVQEEVVEEDPSYAAQVRRMIEAEWDRPDSFDADSEVSVQIRLAVPFGNVLAINYLRPSDDEAINDSISDAIRSASPFDGIRQLSLKEQQELQQFNLHFRAEGIR
ncbi:TonB C-terminal domain-containing protein [Halomonas sp. E19]|uniref:TonB C-terminal domain-containing protein n=1 Tax=Halomonas sp. E19 TaxID=3397247 RepID=UPI004033D4D4